MYMSSMRCKLGRHVMCPPCDATPTTRNYIFTQLISNSKSIQKGGATTLWMMFRGFVDAKWNTAFMSILKLQEGGCDEYWVHLYELQCFNTRNYSVTPNSSLCFSLAEVCKKILFTVRLQLVTLPELYLCQYICIFSCMLTTFHL